MNKFILIALSTLYLFGLPSPNLGFLQTQETDKAYFTIKVEPNRILIDAEFPSTLRNALIKARPDVKNSTDASHFQSALYYYVEENLLLTDKYDLVLKLKSIREIEDKGLTGQYNYRFIYEGGELGSVENTLMFLESNNQINFHTLIIGNESIAFQTTTEDYVYKLSKPINMTTILWAVGILLAGLMISLVTRSRAKKA